MTTEDNMKALKDGVTIIGEVIKAAGDNPNVKAAGQELGQTALTITKTVNNALLPLAAVNFAFDKAREYFAKQFQSDIAAKAATIPPDQIVEPKASLAGPALQSLAFAHEEVDLKEMYLNLLASAMDKRVASHAHPAFVEIIRQLESEEARLLQGGILSSAGIPIAELQLTSVKNSSFTTVFRHLLNLRRKEGEQLTQVDGSHLPPMVDNWIRLGLVTVVHDLQLQSNNGDLYAWVQERPEFLRLKASEDEHHKLTIQRGIMAPTSLGRKFGVAVGLLDANVLTKPR